MVRSLIFYILLLSGKLAFYFRFPSLTFLFQICILFVAVLFHSSQYLCAWLSNCVYTANIPASMPVNVSIFQYSNNFPNYLQLLIDSVPLDSLSVCSSVTSTFIFFAVIYREHAGKPGTFGGYSLHLLFLLLLFFFFWNTLLLH